MKATLAMSAIALAALAVAFLQFQEAGSLRATLALSEAARLALQAEVEANADQQSGVQQQIDLLQENLRRSSEQLLQLSDSLQEARGLLAPAVTAP